MYGTMDAAIMTPKLRRTHAIHERMCYALGVNRLVVNVLVQGGIGVRAYVHRKKGVASHYAPSR